MRSISPAAEDAVRSDHQRDDHQDIRREVLGAAADIRIEVPCGQVLDDAHDQSANHCADNRVKPTEDDDGKHFEPDDSELIVDADHCAPNETGQRRDYACQGPSKGEVAAHIDAHRHRHLLAVCHGAHGNAHAGPKKEPREGSQRDQTNNGADELNRRKHDRSENNRIITDRHVDRPSAGAEGNGGGTAEHRRNADGRHDYGDHRTSDERPEHDTL